MGWFDQQIRNRIKNDNEQFEDTFSTIAGSVMGKRIASALNNNRQSSLDAIELVLSYYHVKRVDVPENITDINDELEYIMRPNGIMRRTVNLEKGWHKDASGAMLASFKESKAIVALMPSGIKGYYFYDENGKKVKVNGKNESLFDYEAIAFYKPFPLKSLSVGELFRFALSSLTFSDYFLFASAVLAVTLIGTLIPILNKRIFSDVIDSGSLSVLIAITVFTLCVSFSSIIMTAIKELLLNKLTLRMSLSVEAATMMRIISLPAKFFKSYSSGELTTRAGYVNTLCTTILSTVISTGFTSVFSLIYVSQIFAYAPALVVPSLIVLFTTVLMSFITTIVQMNITRKQLDVNAKQVGMSYSLISGVQKIKLSGSEKRAFSRWGRLYSEEARLTYDPPLFIKLNSAISTAITLGGTILMYYLAVKTNVTVADYYAFTSAYGLVSGAFISFASVALTIAKIKPIAEMAKPIMEATPEISVGKQVIGKLSGSIEISNVFFRYNDNMPYVVDNMSFKIKPGQYVAIVGTTGCGKSTLMRLLLGFETPNKGGIYFDGKDINSIDLKSLRRQIGVVMQNGKLFSGDIFSNITISAPWLTLDDAWEAARLAGVAEDIEAMPMGMHTVVSEGSGGISGGQKQRLMIARAIAPKPKILMFDEATSALDNITQKTVSESLENLKCTRIVIAHRLSTIKQCDRIIVLDKGHIIEDGTYADLIEKNGFFAELVERQRIDANS